MQPVVGMLGHHTLPFQLELICGGMKTTLLIPIHELRKISRSSPPSPLLLTLCQKEYFDQLGELLQSIPIQRSEGIPLHTLSLARIKQILDSDGHAASKVTGFYQPPDAKSDTTVCASINLSLSLSVTVSLDLSLDLSLSLVPTGSVIESHHLKTEK
jgi:hypothetical protein